jgi:hypothetical protein
MELQPVIEEGPKTKKRRRKLAPTIAAVGLAFGVGAVVDHEFFPKTQIQIEHEGNASNTNETTTDVTIHN